MNTKRSCQRVDKTDINERRPDRRSRYEKPQIKKQQRLAEVTGGKKVTG